MEREHMHEKGSQWKQNSKEYELDENAEFEDEDEFEDELGDEKYAGMSGHTPQVDETEHTGRDSSVIPLFFYPYIGGHSLTYVDNVTNTLRRSPKATMFNAVYVFKTQREPNGIFYNIYRPDDAPAGVLIESDYLVDAQKYPTKKTIRAWDAQLRTLMHETKLDIGSAETLLQYYRDVPLAIAKFRENAQQPLGVQAQVPLYFNPNVGRHYVWFYNQHRVKYPNENMNQKNYLYTFQENILGAPRMFYDISNDPELPSILTDEQRYPTDETKTAWSLQIKILMDTIKVPQKDAETYLNFFRTVPKAIAGHALSLKKHMAIRELAEAQAMHNIAFPAQEDFEIPMSLIELFRENTHVDEKMATWYIRKFNGDITRALEFYATQLLNPDAHSGGAGSSARVGGNVGTWYSRLNNGNCEPTTKLQRKRKVDTMEEMMQKINTFSEAMSTTIKVAQQYLIRYQGDLEKAINAFVLESLDSQGPSGSAAAEVNSGSAADGQTAANSELSVSEVVELAKFISKTSMTREIALRYICEFGTIELANNAFDAGVRLSRDEKDGQPASAAQIATVKQTASKKLKTADAVIDDAFMDIFMTVTSTDHTTAREFLNSKRFVNPDTAIMAYLENKFDNSET